MLAGVGGLGCSGAEAALEMLSGGDRLCMRSSWRVSETAGDVEAGRGSYSSGIVARTVNVCNKYCTVKTHAFSRIPRASCFGIRASSVPLFAWTLSGTTQNQHDSSRNRELP